MLSLSLRVKSSFLYPTLLADQQELTTRCLQGRALQVPRNALPITSNYSPTTLPEVIHKTWAILYSSQILLRALMGPRQYSRQYCKDLPQQCPLLCTRRQTLRGHSELHYANFHDHNIISCAPSLLPSVRKETSVQHTTAKTAIRTKPETQRTVLH